MKLSTSKHDIALPSGISANAAAATDSGEAERPLP